jgi:hypothetical protein
LNREIFPAFFFWRKRKIHNNPLFTERIIEMNKSATNFWVDAVAFAAFLFLAATGAITRYMLPPGTGHFRSLWGMDRHDWGGVHFWIAVVFLITLALHVILHWRWITGMIKGQTRPGARLRITLAFMGLLFLLGIAISPFFSSVVENGEPPHKARSGEPTEKSMEQIVNGSMTLQEIEQRTGVSAAVILKELGLPPDTPTNERVGRLRKKYGFEMHTVQAIVQKHLEQQ